MTLEYNIRPAFSTDLLTPLSPLLLLHGWTHSQRIFDLLVPKIDKRLEVYTLTQRGFAGSTQPGPLAMNGKTSAYRMELFADDVLAFMDAMHIERVSLAGHSMGGSIAQRSEEPSCRERVCTLV